MKETPSLKRFIKDLKLAAYGYKRLMGKQFMLVYEGNYIEIKFSKKYFKHLTGIESTLNAKIFFDASFSGRIRKDQISFDENHPYLLCVKKLKHIMNLENSLCSDLLLLHRIKTKTYIIPKGLTNLNYVLGLDVNDDMNNRKVDDNLVPYTLRVEDKKAFENSENQYQVDYIFSKQICEKQYSKLCFGDVEKLDSLPNNVKGLINLDKMESYGI